MSAPNYRVTRPGDESALLEIWKAAYDGDTSSASIYFDHYYHPGDGIVADVDGTLCSAIYLLEGYTLHIPGKEAHTCSYLYALGTPSEYRGKGYGGKTIWHSGVEGYHRGADFVCFLPASESLYHWYEGCLGTHTVFYRREFSVIASEARCIPAISLAPCTPEEYLAVRKTILANTPHAHPSLSATALQRDYCRLYGGDLSRFQFGNHTGLCAWDREGDTLIFREFLLSVPDPTAAIQGILKSVHATEASVRTPAFFHEGLGTVVDDNVLVPGGYTFPKSEQPPYWGFSMD